VAAGALTFETGRLAPLADSAVTATLGQTCVLAAIVAEPARPERQQRGYAGLKVAPRPACATLQRRAGCALICSQSPAQERCQWRSV